MSGTSAGWLLVLPARLELLHIKGWWQAGMGGLGRPQGDWGGFLNLSAPIRILRRDPGDTGTGHRLATWSWSSGWSSWTQHGHGVPGCTAPQVASGHHQATTRVTTTPPHSPSRSPGAGRQLQEEPGSPKAPGTWVGAGASAAPGPVPGHPRLPPALGTPR